MSVNLFMPNSENTGASSRKKDHIALAFEARTTALDSRFYYEPMLSAHPNKTDLSCQFLGKKLKNPIWVSSMTGGTEMAKTINKNLAIACNEFGMGMGLGSCRQLLDDKTYFDDFNVRPHIGTQPLYINLGIAQIEILLKKKETGKISTLIKNLDADGLIIHINPLQEWLQPEGDLISVSPIDSIKNLLKEADYPIIVKEVGQGMGKESLKSLLGLPIAAIEFAAHGGTNFSLLELMRASKLHMDCHQDLAKIGHTAEQMVDFFNELKTQNDLNIKCKQIIISGGIRHYLDGYYLTQKINTTAIYGLASTLLEHAQGDYNDLQAFLEQHIEGLRLAHAFLKIRT